MSLSRIHIRPKSWQPLTALASALLSFQFTEAGALEVCSDAAWRKLTFVKAPVSQGYFYGIEHWTSSDVQVSRLCHHSQGQSDHSGNILSSTGLGRNEAYINANGKNAAAHSDTA